MVVYAVATDGSRFYYVEKASYGLPAYAIPDQEWNQYSLEGVAPGDYFVLAAPRDSHLTWAGGFTKASQCGATVACTDHTLVPVHVSPGSTVSGIDPGDGNFFSQIPSGGPPPIDPVLPSATFQDPKHAAIYLVQGAAFITPGSAEYVESKSECRLNLACAWLTGEVDGNAAAYFTYQLGTNGLFRTCTIYLLKTAAGWQFLEANCHRLAGAFPAVGSDGQLTFPPKSFESGCINIHSSPGLASKVAACLPEKTAVTIDDGPSYLPEATSPPDLTKNYWWHIANRGWVVDRYVGASP